MAILQSTPDARHPITVVRSSQTTRRQGMLARGVALVGLLVLLAGCGAAQAAAGPASHATLAPAVALDIMPVKPLGPAENWPAYLPSGEVRVPANTVVTVTIRNFDVGDDALPESSPFLHVQGTTDGLAYVDGKAYTALEPDHVSHTFTIPQLNLNVPIPGDPVGDANHVTVTFSFRTPANGGAYTFQCYVPCGTGASGFDGPMATMGYMRGTLTVVA